MLMACRDCYTNRHDCQQQELPTAAQAEGTTVCHLDEIVEESDRSAPERHEQHGKRRHFVLAHREERRRGDDEDQQPAHRRSALLAAVRFESFLLNVLPELVPSEKGDEPGADEDRQHHGHDRSDENANHAGTFASAAAIASKPIARDAFTRTTSPGRTTSSSSRMASCTFATQRPGTPLSR